MHTHRENALVTTIRRITYDTLSKQITRHSTHCVCVCVCVCILIAALFSYAFLTERESAEECAGGRFIELLVSMLVPPTLTSQFKPADWPPKPGQEF